MAVRQVASIHFKNFVAKNWSPHEAGEPPMIPENAKIMIRDNILTFVAQVPPLLRYIIFHVEINLSSMRQLLLTHARF
ncbi:hypothetical protein GW17_00042584 [Ensete ventricosum]|nr:hypothetical protein GW17_00042584 [Ensete ventricosum]